MSFTDDSQLHLLHRQSQSATSRLLKSFKFGAKSSPFSPAPTEAEQPVIPDPEVFCSLTVNRLDGHSPIQIKAKDIPTVAQCAVHLELLEAFLVLKTKVLQSQALDRAFGIAAPARKRANLTTVRKRKWKGYVSLAVVRFERWWQNVDQVMFAVRKQADYSDAVLELTASTLPPLDVLMVWHTLMLNPTLYHESCEKQCPELWKVGLPWAAIHEVIDGSSRAYNLPTAAITLFESITGLQPDLFGFLADFSNLPDNARKILSLAEDRETAFSEHWVLHGSLSMKPQDAMFRAYLEREMFVLPRLKVDSKQYIEKVEGKAKHTFTEAFPQLKATEERYIGALVKYAFPTERELNKVKDLNSLKAIFNKGLSPLIFPKSQNKTLFEQAFERLLSSYVTTPMKIDASEIEAAIFRQGEFVEKMGNLLWIRSPSLHRTLSRAISRYEKFFTLLAAFPEKVVVPTLDVDIVWHTHQCAPARYFAYCQASTGRFINHDDSIAKGTLEKAFHDTKELFYLRFGEEYSRCLCWDCEALLTAVEEAVDMEASEGEKIAEHVTADVTYFRAVEMARREGKMLPIRK